MGRIISFHQLKKLILLPRQKKTVLVGGCFDIIHYGHWQFLKKAKKEGNFLMVALESDEFIKKNKKRRPFHNQRQRAKILASFSMVDLVILLPFFKKDEDYFNLVKIIKPKIIAVTEGDSQLKNKKKQAEEVGASLKIVTPLVKNFSTTKIIMNF